MLALVDSALLIVCLDAQVLSPTNLGLEVGRNGAIYDVLSVFILQ